MIPKKIIHLLSGGLDSVTMLHYLKHEGNSIHCILFDYKQPHAEQELGWAKYHCRLLGVNFTKKELPELGGLSNESFWIVDNRNAIFLHVAANMASRTGSDAVTIGCNAADEEGFPDCRKGFIDSVQQSLNKAEIPVEICAPFLDWPKWKIARLAADMGVKPHTIWTCYRGGSEPCGECPACVKLRECYK